MSAATEATRDANHQSALRLTLTLGVAGLVSGLLLVGAYEWTLPRIKANEAKAMERAVLKVVPGSKVVKRLRKTTQGLEEVGGDSESPVFGAYSSDGKLKGYALMGAGPGFQDTIVLIYGYDPHRKLVTGLEIIDSRETPGLGDKIFKDAAFGAEFKALSVEPAVTLLKGSGSTEPNVVDAITGATISSRAVVNIVNATNDAWRIELDQSVASARESGGR